MLLKSFISEIIKKHRTQDRLAEIVAASKEYLKKEEIRQTIENIIKTRVASKQIMSQNDLDSFFKDVDIASRALKAIPFEVFKKLSNK